MEQVALVDRLDEQRVVVLVAGRAGAGRGDGAVRAVVGRRGEGACQQPARAPHLAGQSVEHAHAISANAAAAASTVRFTCSGVWASDGNQASNCDGGG